MGTCIAAALPAFARCSLWRPARSAAPFMRPGGRRSRSSLPGLLPAPSLTPQCPNGPFRRLAPRRFRRRELVRIPRPILTSHGFAAAVKLRRSEQTGFRISSPKLTLGAEASSARRATGTWARVRHHLREEISGYLLQVFAVGARCCWHKPQLALLPDGRLGAKRA